MSYDLPPQFVSGIVEEVGNMPSTNEEALKAIYAERQKQQLEGQSDQRSRNLTAEQRRRMEETSEPPRGFYNS